MADDQAETSDLLVEAAPVVLPEPELRAPAARRRGLHNSRWLFGLVALAGTAALATVIWASTMLHPGPAVYRFALFLHLSALVVGFGAVIAADYFCLLWVVKRSSLSDALLGVSRLHLLIWTGLVGLAVSGALLEPHLSAPLTRVKLGLVFILTLNGLQAIVLSERMLASVAPVSRRLIAWGAVTATVSQGCWWGAVVIGFLTATGGHR